MRQSSFEKPVDESSAGLITVTNSSARRDRSDLHDRIGAWLVALTAFVCWYQRGGPPSGVSLETSWFDPLMRGFTHGWQWGSDIIYTYGPLGFLTPYITWSAETGAAFRVGQIFLCTLWALMAFAFARGLGTLRQLLLVLAMLAFYPLLTMDIGWNVPFVFAVVLIYRMVDESPLGAHRTAWYMTIILLLGVLAMVKFTGQVMWVGVMGYATLLGLQRRDYRTAFMFGIVGPLVFLAIWLVIGQSISGLGAYMATSIEMSAGYGAMSINGGARLDAVGIGVLMLLAASIVLGFWTATVRRSYILVATALLVMSFMVWKAGYVRADGHVAIFFGSAAFIALACLCLPLERSRAFDLVRWIGIAVLSITCLIASYGFTGYQWTLRPMADALTSLLHPAASTAERVAQSRQSANAFELPRTRARVGESKVDVLGHEQSIAFRNDLDYQPRPIIQGYAAYTPSLARINEASILDPATAPEYLLAKLQSIDNHLPTSEDPLTVLAALRGYLPVDLEGGYLVMRRTGWPVAPIKVPDAADWRVVTLGADIEIPATPSPQVLFFDVQLGFWARLRSAFLREPNLRVELALNDGSTQTHLLVRRLGLAGMLISPFLLSEGDYLLWHAGLAEQRVMSMRLLAADPAEIRLFKPHVAYALQPIDLPRVRVDKLSEELQQILYPGFHPAPMLVQSGRVEVVTETGRNVLFTHAPATLEFALAAGEWTATGSFGLLSSAYQCEVSDGVALVADRVDAGGNSTRLFSRQINPVRNPAERGALDFEFGPFPMQDGDRMILRNEIGLASDAKGDCDWMFLGPVNFKQVAAEREKN